MGEHVGCVAGCDGGAEEFPHIFGVVVASIERDAESVGDGGVEGGLHIVDGLRDEVQACHSCDCQYAN